jgi:hypothetical protein
MPRSTAKKSKLGHYPESELEQLNVDASLGRGWTPPLMLPSKPLPVKGQSSLCSSRTPAASVTQ